MKKPKPKKAAKRATANKPRKVQPASKLTKVERRDVLRKAAKQAAKPKKKPALQKIAPVLGQLVDAATGTGFGPTPAESRDHRIDTLKLKDSLTPKERAELLKVAPRPADTRWPSEIRVGKRFRQRMGDLDAQARSIERGQRNGEPLLLQAVGLNPKDDLIFGERRFNAWKRTKFVLTHPIPVRVLDIEVIEGEWIENDPALRKNFDIEEAVEIVRAMRPRQRELLEIERASRDSTTRPAPGRTAAKGAASGRVADRAAAFVGKDRKTLAKGEALVDAAAENPEKYGPLLEDAKRTSKVDGPFNRLKILRAAEAMLTNPPQMPDGTFVTGLIDFPWPNEIDASQEEIDATGRSLRPYPAMAIDAGATFMREQVLPRLGPDCTLWFCVTNFHLVSGAAHRVLDGLGEEFKASTMLSWRKDKLGRGQVLRDQTEHVIVLTRGKPVINVLGKDPPTTWLDAPRRDNSRKPDELFRLIERVSPAPEYLSVFSTGGEGENWKCFGDQVEKHASAAQQPVADDATRQLLADRIFAALDTQTRDEILLELLERVAADPDYQIGAVDQSLAAELEPLIAGKRKLKLTGTGKKSREALHKRLMLSWMEAVEGGRGAELPVYARAELKEHGHISALSAKKLTASGKHALGYERDDKTRADLIASLPADVPALTAMYLDAIKERHARILAGDKSAVSKDAMGGPPDSVVDAITQKAIELGRANKDSGPDTEWPDDTIRKASRAAIGEVPMWGQHGVFRLIVDGLPVLCVYTPDEWFEDLGLFAEEVTRGFVSDTGYRKVYEDAPMLGCTVAQYAEKMIREELRLEPLGPRTGGKRKPRKDDLPLPSAVYAMPADWSAIEREMLPEVGGIKGEKKPRKSSRKKKGDAGDVAATGAQETKGAANQVTIGDSENAVLYRIPDDVIAAIGKLGGHTVSMTSDGDQETGLIHIGTCPCGAAFRATQTGIAGANEVEHAIEAHWREQLAAVAAPAEAPKPAADDYPDAPQFLLRNPQTEPSQPAGEPGVSHGA